MATPISRANKMSHSLPSSADEDSYRQAIFFEQVPLGAWTCIGVAALCFITFVRSPIWSMVVASASFLIAGFLQRWCWSQVQQHGYRLGTARVLIGAIMGLSCISIWLAQQHLVLVAVMVIILMVFESSYCESALGTLVWQWIGIALFFGGMLLRRIIVPPTLSTGPETALLYYALPCAIIYQGGRFGSLTVQYLRSALALAQSRSAELQQTLASVEQQVRDRTADLAAVNSQLEAANVQLRAYAAHAETLATERERTRLAREIHDSVGSALAGMRVRLDTARSLLARDPAQAQAVLEDVSGVAEAALRDTRRSVAALRAEPLDGHTVREAIQPLINHVIAAGVTVNVAVIGTVRPLSAEVEQTLYRAVQEGLTNIQKYAQASRIDITLDYDDPTVVRLTIEDNGQGSADPQGGYGLVGLRERVTLCGGTLALTTALGEGFVIDVEVPDGGNNSSLGRG